MVDGAGFGLAATRRAVLGGSVALAAAWSMPGVASVAMPVVSTRAGKVQIFTVGRDGKGLRQITKIGNNFTPDWSH